jgi:PKD repeat protein
MMHSERRIALIGNPHRAARHAPAFGPQILWALGLGACLAFGAATAAAQPLKAPSKARAESAGPGPQSQYIAISIDDTNGQFTMGVPHGGPILLYGYPDPWSSFTSFRVDGTNVTDLYDPFGTMIQPPTNTSSTTNEGIWQLGTGNLRVHQIITLVSGPASGRPDTYLIQYEVDNLDSVSHTVGCRVMLDTDLGANRGAPFRVPGVGSVTQEVQFDGVGIPSYFFVFNDLSQPDVAAQGTLVDPQVSLDPDRVQIVNWDGIFATDFYYTVDPSTSITGDSAYAVYWLDHVIPPGQSVVFSTLYGLGNIQVDSADPLITAETAPVSLTCINHQYAPSPFDISLTLSNIVAGAPDPVTGITVTLDLPPGLELASGSAAVNLPDMPVNDVQFVSWKVVADGNVTGSLGYSIDLATSNFGSKTLNYAVQVPPACLCPNVSLVSVDPTACPATTAQVSVAEHGGSPVTGLDASAFGLQEDGQDVAITSVAPVGGLPGTYRLTWTTLHGDGMQHSLSVSATFNDCTVSAAGTVQCTCSGLSCDASAPASAQAHSAAAFTASGTITGCTAPLSYQWSFGDGGASAQQDPSHTYNAGGSYNWSVVVSGGGLTCTRSGTLAVAVDPPVITSMKKVAPPFTIAVNGSNLQHGIRVYINGTEWTQVLDKKPTKIKLTGGKSLKAVVPKGVPALFHFVNPDGGSADLTWSW